MTYKGCKITAYRNGYVWEDTVYGAEADDVFPTVEATKADIDRFFGNGPTPTVINNEIEAR